MANKKKVQSYEEKQFDISQDVHSVIANCLEDLKRDVNSNSYTWNKPVEELKGITVSLIGQNHIQLNYHRYFVGNQYEINKAAEDEKNILSEVEKELKKRFKKITKKNLNLKKVSEDRDIQAFSRLTPDTSWMLGSSRHGYGNNIIGRFHIRWFRIYTYDNPTADDE